MSNMREAVFSGLWLLRQALTRNEVTIYRCPACRWLIRPNSSPCPFCGEGISWDRTEVR